MRKLLQSLATNAVQSLHKTYKGCRAKIMKMSCNIAHEAEIIIPEQLNTKEKRKKKAGQTVTQSTIRKRQKCKEWKKKGNYRRGKKKEQWKESLEKEV